MHCSTLFFSTLLMLTTSALGGIIPRFASGIFSTIRARDVYFHHSSDSQNLCGASTFVADTSANPVSVDTCTTLRNAAVGVYGYWTVSAFDGNGFVAMTEVPGCGFHIKQADGSGDAAQVGDSDLTDLIQSAIDAFASDGSFPQVSGVMPCGSGNDQIEWELIAT